MQQQHRRRSIRRYITLIPNFIRLIGRLMRDPRVSKADRAILLATILYTLTPLDLLADFIPFWGLVDDTFLIGVALTRLLLRAGEEPLRDNWSGEGDIVGLINAMRRVAEVLLPRRIRQQLLGKVQD
ncbi:MAG: DUF1232 domain-containing protein [Blastocatellia bacterium]|nr:DUF1232 domain-containing protein [Blastocatellia bacterium]